VLAEPQPPENLEFSTGIWHYVRAVAYANLDDLDAARAERAKLVPLRDAADVVFLDTINYPATSLLKIADELVLGEIAMAEGNADAAIDHFKIAVDTQDGLPYTEPPFWYYPTRHSLGIALLTAGKAGQAEAVYRRDLEIYPRNGWAMYGLIESLKSQGKDASDVMDNFALVWSEADVTLSASSF
jgi:tetratricopeptide (TPR) repeat protein